MVKLADDRRRLKRLHDTVDERKRRTGTTTLWTLSKLENMQYVVDKTSFLQYSTPLIVNKVVVKGPFRSSYRKISRNQLRRMTWRNIVRCADAMGIMAELLVDEEHYYKRCGLAGYRVVFEAARQGISLAELTHYPGQSDHPKYQYSWYSLWYMFLKGSLNMQKYLNLQHLTTIIQLCNERLQMPIGALVSRTLRHDAESAGTLGELADLLVSLDQRDCVLVAGVAQAVYNSKVGGLSLDEQIKTLLEWYRHGPTPEGKGSCASGGFC